MTAPAHWRYEEPSTKGEGWFIAFLDDAGCLAVLSDFGDYSYRWSMGGMPEKDGRRISMREWVAFHLGKDPRYVLSKISSLCELDSDAACKAARERLAQDLADGTIDQDTADREEEYIADYLDNARTEDAAGAWMAKTKIDEPWNLLSSCYPHRAVAFMDRVFPRLVALVRADLEGKK